MKKNILNIVAFISVVLFPVTISGQSIGENNNEYNKAPSFGIKAGANLSNVYDTQGDEFQADAKIGIAAGAFLTLPFTRFIGLQPEILISQKGYQGSGSLLGSDYSFTRTTNYIDIPLLLSFRSNKYITLLFGPQYSFLISQNYSFKSDIINISKDEQFENENLRKNTLCITGGMDFNLNKLVLSVRAGWDILKNEGDGTSSTPRYKNTWYQATVGYRF